MRIDPTQLFWGLGTLSGFSIRPSGVNEGLCNDVDDCGQPTGQGTFTCNGNLAHDGSANFFGNK